MTSRYRFSSAKSLMGSRKHLTDGVEAVDELVDLLGDRVEVEARPIGSRDAELLHQRLAAVVAGADRNALQVEDLRDVVRMDVLEVERDDAGATIGGRAVEPDARHLRQAAERVGGELVLVRLDRVEPDSLEIVDRRAEADRLRHRRRARLELVRQLAPGCFLEAYRVDHVAAGEERIHREQQVGPPPERARAARPAHLVARDREEVDAERLHVDLRVRRALRGVADVDRALRVRPLGELRNRVDRGERVRDEVRRDDLDPAAAGHLVQGGKVELALLVERDHPQLGAGLAGDELPRHEVRVVLEFGDHYEVARAEVREAPGIGDEIDPLGRVAGEDDLAGVGRVEEGPYPFPRMLERLGRALGQHVDTAVDVRVRGLVDPRHRIEHLPRLLRAGGRIEEGERLAVDLLLEDREVAAQRLRVELRFGRNSHALMVTRRFASEALHRRSYRRSP